MLNFQKRLFQRISMCLTLHFLFDGKIFEKIKLHKCKISIKFDLLNIFYKIGECYDYS